MRQARIAISLLAVAAFAGCQEDPEPVAQVPGPAPYDSTYTPLDPVGVAPGQYNGANQNGYTTGDPAPGQAANAGVPQVGGGRTYIIQRGDTLWSIATRVYGDGQKHVDIARANPSIADPAKLAVGQEIVLP